MKRCFAAILAGLVSLTLGCSRADVSAIERKDPSLAQPSSEDESMTGNNRDEAARGEVFRGERVEKTDDQWRELLTAMEFDVTRRSGTEPPGTGEYEHAKTAGTYRCVCCGAPLFSSDHKFDSGSGWPAFYQTAGGGFVATREDRGLFSVRIELRCRRCDAHLGHVFEDAPQTPTGLRYCINSAALRLEPARQNKEQDESNE